MIGLVEKNEKKFYERFIGKTVEVLFEQQIKDKEGYYEGLTSNYIKIVSYSDKNIEGKLATVELEEIKEGLIMGIIKKILDM